MSKALLMVSAVLAPAEFILNQLLRQDTLLAEKLFAQKDTVLKINCTSPGMTVFLIIDDSRIRFTQDYSGDVSAGFSGSLSTLMSLLLKTSHSLHESEVEVTGDMQKAQAIQNLLAASSIDWGFHFSRFFGDIPVQAASELAEKTRETARQNLSSLKLDLDEYLHEETRLLPGKAELEIFNNNLDALKLGLDRVRARITRLDATISQANTPEGQVTHDPAYSRLR